MAYESDPIAARLNDLVVEQEAYGLLLFFDGLNPVEKAFIGVWELVQQVYNGGFMQLFQNSSGARVHETCAILRRIGADQAASIVERAIALAGPDVPWNDDIRRFEVVQGLSEHSRDELARSGLDFYQQLDEVHRLLWQYLAAHRDQIDAPENFWTEFTQ